MSLLSLIESLIPDPKQALYSYKVLPAGGTFIKSGMCPYCGADLEVYCTGWEQDETGLWVMVTADMDCVEEPDIEKFFDWCEWDLVHGCEPYTYYLPVELEIGKWITDNYRFYFND